MATPKNLFISIDPATTPPAVRDGHPVSPEERDLIADGFCVAEADRDVSVVATTCIVVKVLAVWLRRSPAASLGVGSDPQPTPALFLTPHRQTSHPPAEPPSLRRGHPRKAFRGRFHLRRHAIARKPLAPSREADEDAMDVMVGGGGPTAAIAVRLALPRPLRGAILLKHRSHRLGLHAGVEPPRKRSRRPALLDSGAADPPSTPQSPDAICGVCYGDEASSWWQLPCTTPNCTHLGRAPGA